MMLMVVAGCWPQQGQGALFGVQRCGFSLGSWYKLLSGSDCRDLLPIQLLDHMSTNAKRSGSASPALPSEGREEFGPYRMLLVGCWVHPGVQPQLV